MVGSCDELVRSYTRSHRSMIVDRSWRPWMAAGEQGWANPTADVKELRATVSRRPSWRPRLPVCEMCQ